MKSTKKEFIHASLFSGIGGFDLAADWVGWKNILQCEINPFCQKVLKYYWPKAELFENIKTTDFTKYANRIDVLSGGFPCQPYSVAGKRHGKEDDRHLWPYMLRAIQQIKPTWVVGENVRGIISWDAGLVFNEVQTDLETKGYEVQPFILPAAGVNAPHERYRVFFVAYNHMFREQSRCANSNIKKESSKVGNSIFEQTDRPCSEQFITYTSSARWKKLHTSEISDKTRHAAGRNIENWANWPTQSPVCSGNDGLPPPLAGITVSKHRSESIKGYGNAIVPQVVLQIFEAINQYEKLINSKL